LDILEKALYLHDDKVAILLNTLASLYHTEGKYTEAEPLFKRSLAIREKILGPEHPDVAAVCENMAKFYRKIGKTKEAEKLEIRSQKIRSSHRAR
jgi:tetratricopeptide (TPR) repeat protein